MSPNKEELVVIDITSNSEDERIDKVIVNSIDTLSRSFIQKQIKEGRVLVNQLPIKQNYRVKENDHVEFMIPAAIEPAILPENIPLDILFEDSDLLIVNKPKGMVVHPAAGHYNGTLVNAILFHCKDSLSGINGVLRPGIVHRIDKDTTGSLIICKNDKAHNSIAIQLKEHSVNRKYRAIVHGNLNCEEGTISAPIGRDRYDRKKMAVSKDGKNAVTHYRVLERLKGFSYIECCLETGRTHQIRVHMASLGHPLLGDVTYGSRSKYTNLQGQCLHAMIIGFLHPTTGAYVEIEAPLPEYFVHILQILRS